MKSRFPHPLLIIVSFILLAGVATYLLPQGEYERTIDPVTNREVVVSGSYHSVEAAPLSPFEILVAVPRGIAKGLGVIVMIFMGGACFYVVEKTGALKAGILYLTHRFKGREEFTLVLVGVFFLAGGTLEGMEEEVIPLIPILLFLGRRLGFDAFVVISVSYGATVIGASMSPLNAFGVLLAQKIANVPIFSAWLFRMVVLIVAFVLWMWMILRYGKKNRLTRDVSNDDIVAGPISRRHGVILLIVVMTFAMLIFGLMKLDWGFDEMSAEFFLVGLVCGLIGGLGLNGTSSAYVEGLREMTFAALIVGFAHGISLVLMDGKILDTVIYGLFVPMESLPPSLSAIGMMTSQFFLHVFVPSYTGQAALTLPILAPLSDLIGLSRQVCVLAFQYGAIMMNLLSPTCGSLMAILALSGISYDQWFGFVIRRMAVLFLCCMIAVTLASFLI